MSENGCQSIYGTDGGPHANRFMVRFIHSPSFGLTDKFSYSMSRLVDFRLKRKKNQLNVCVSRIYNLASETFTSLRKRIFLKVVLGFRISSVFNPLGVFLDNFTKADILKQMEKFNHDWFIFLLCSLTNDNFSKENTTRINFNRNKKIRGIEGQHEI